MAFFFPSTPFKKSADESGRAQEFENLIGNYFITDHQLKRLTDRLCDYVKLNPNKSTFMLRSNDDDKPRWFIVRVEMEEIKDESKPETETEPVEPESEPTMAITEDELNGEESPII